MQGRKVLSIVFVFSENQIFTKHVNIVCNLLQMEKFI